MKNKHGKAEANKIALEEADKGVRNYYETKNQYLNNI